MAIKFEVDPTFPNLTLYDIAGTCDAIAGLLQLQLAGGHRASGSIELGEDAMNGLALIIKAMASAAREVDDLLAPQLAARAA